MTVQKCSLGSETSYFSKCLLEYRVRLIAPTTNKVIESFSYGASNDVAAKDYVALLWELWGAQWTITVSIGNRLVQVIPAL